MTAPTSRQVSNAQLADDLRHVLRQLVRRLRHEDEQDGSGMPLQQKRVLHAISQQPNIGVAELARQENVKGPTMSGHVKSLEAAGYIARSDADPLDRRRTGLAVTAKGAAFMRDLQRRRQDWLAGKIAELPGEGVEVLQRAVGYLGEIGR
jgi:DNA-binding MarR family transcriptional regulator